MFNKSTTIHPILFAIFPILLIITSNLDEVIFKDAGFSLLIVIGITMIFWIFLNLFFKNKSKSGLLVSLGLILFFSYGHFTRFTSQIGIDVSALPFSHTTYAVPFYGIMLIIGIFAIIKIKKRLKDVTALTNIIGVVIIVMLLPNVVSYSLENNNLDAVKNEMDYRILHEPELNEKPNIYYIILDEYTSDEILSEIYNYDNQEFLSKLSQRGFHIPINSYTNYVTSPLAISANLNMSYFNDGKINPTLDNRNKFYNDNQIMQILKSLDYTIINMSLDYGYPEIADHHLCAPSMFVNQFHSSLIDGTIWHPFSKYFVTAGDPQRDRVNCKFSELSNLENSFETPFFVLGHIMSPHPPYLFGPNGESLNPEFLAIGAASWDNKSGYVNQIQYINKKIIETIDKILLENDSPPIIIIQGDHGTPTQLGGGGLRWENINDDSIRERISIFNAYYFPNIDSKVIYDGITPVNSFRLVLNNYFNGDYELLEDKIYFSTYQDMLNLTDVTSITIKTDSKN
jgi:hypothetical protein